MRIRLPHHSRFMVMFIAFVVVAISMIAADCRSWAGTPGVLRLMVQSCVGSSWMSGANISVTIVRSGAGAVDTGSGVTNSAGYVEIAFDDLETDDEAVVTVTPANQGPRSEHIYLWVDFDDRPGIFDIEVGSSRGGCDDGWYNETSDIILCRHSL
jgi:hypothetical protein